MTEWQMEQPDIAQLLYCFESEGLFEAMSNGYARSSNFEGPSKYAHLCGILLELEDVHAEFKRWEGHLIKEMNRFIPEEDRL